MTTEAEPEVEAEAETETEPETTGEIELAQEDQMVDPEPEPALEGETIVVSQDDRVVYDDPDLIVNAYHTELDATDTFPIFAYDSYWADRGWTSYDVNDPNDQPWAGAPETEALGAEVPPEDGAPE